MLTTTYAIVALSVEQASVRMSLGAFRNYVQCNLKYQKNLDRSHLEFVLNGLTSLYDVCRWRKVDIYLIPALRQVTQQADNLLEDLDKLNRQGLDLLKSLQKRLRRATDKGAIKSEELFGAIEQFCNMLQQKLEREENELFAIARRVITGDVWFSVGKQFLLHDAEKKERKDEKKSPPVFLEATGGA